TKSDQRQDEDQPRPASRNRRNLRKGFKVKAASLASEEEKSRKQKSDAQVSRDQIDPARPAHIILLVLERDEEIGRERHGLPRHEEKQRRPGDQDHRHPGHKHREEKPGRSKRFLLPKRLEIVGAVNGCERGENQDGKQEERA